VTRDELFERIHCGDVVIELARHHHENERPFLQFRFRNPEARTPELYATLLEHIGEVFWRTRANDTLLCLDPVKHRPSWHQDILYTGQHVEVCDDCATLRAKIEPMPRKPDVPAGEIQR